MSLYFFKLGDAANAAASVLPQTPWGGHDDYDFPASVGAVRTKNFELNLEVRCGVFIFFH